MALDARAVERFPTGSVAANERGHAKCVASQRLKIVMTGLAVVVPGRMNGRNGAGRCLLLAGTSAQCQPGGVAGGEQRGDCQEPPLRANQQVGLLVVIKRDAERALLGG